MQARWRAIEKAYSAKGIDPTALFQPPATNEDFRRLRSVTSLSLPAEAEAFYRIHNGQRLGISGVMFGIELLSIDRMIENWQMWESLAGDGLNEDLASSMASEPPGVIAPLYINLQWLPLTHDGGGNHLGLDFDPGPRGTVGQVIAFGRDEDTKRLVAPGFVQFVDQYLRELQTIDWKLDFQDGWKISDAQRAERHYHDWPR